MKSGTAKITRKGIEDGVVTLQPVRDAAGSLREFAENVKRGVSMKQMRDNAWREAMREKHVKKSS